MSLLFVDRFPIARWAPIPLRAIDQFSHAEKLATLTQLYLELRQERRSKIVPLWISTAYLRFCCKRFRRLLKLAKSLKQLAGFISHSRLLPATSAGWKPTWKQPYLR
jgi:hypothetical protein